MRTRPNRTGGRLLAGAGALAILGATTSTQAGTLYRLHDHPNGAVREPGYGLRLDELVNFTRDHDVFTFSFDHSGAEMFLYHDGSTIEIWGTVYGGLDIGEDWHPRLRGLYEVSFTYTSIESVPGDDDVWNPDDRPQNSGSISAVGRDMHVELHDFAGSHEYTFRFGDENHDSGHRRSDGMSGWGWLNHGSNRHVYSSDWLFTAEVIPAPPAALLGAAGLIIAAVGRRRVLGRRS